MGSYGVFREVENCHFPVDGQSGDAYQIAGMSTDGLTASHNSAVGFIYKFYEPFIFACGESLAA